MIETAEYMYMYSEVMDKLKEGLHTKIHFYFFNSAASVDEISIVPSREASDESQQQHL